MLKKKAPSFQFYPKDWLTDSEAMAMPNEAMGMYIKLICLDWVNDGIPDDDSVIMRLAGYDHTNFQGEPRDNEDYRVCLSHVKARFLEHPNKPGVITNPRLLKERDKQRAFHNERSSSGKAGAMSKWNSHKTANGSAIRQPMAKNGSSSSSSSSSSDKKKEETPQTPQGVSVDKFWKDWESKPTGPEKNRAILYQKNGTKVYEVEGQPPYIVQGDLEKLISAYKITTGFAPWDRTWDNSKAGFARAAKAAKQLLNDLGLDESLVCLNDCAYLYESKGLSWTLETVAKNSMDWKAGRLKGDN